MGEPNKDELRAKVQEFYELLFGRIPDFIRPIVIAQHIKDGDIAREMRDFYATHRRLPVIERNPSGIGLVMEGKDEDQRPVAQERPKISEEARRFGREDKELRSALRNALCRRKRAHLEWLAKQHGKTPEQLTEGELDAYVEHGWGEAFRLYKAKYERYPLPTELNEVAWMALEESGQTDLSKPRSVLKLGPPAVWRGAMSDDVRAKIREYATHYVNLPETPERRMAETPEGREKVIEFLTNRWAQLGLADALEKHYAEHGCYPDFADIPKFNLKICF